MPNNPSPTEVEEALAGAPDSGLIARKDVIDLLSRLAEENADGALYGVPENARSREAAEAALTRVKYAVAFLPSPGPSAEEGERTTTYHVSAYDEGGYGDNRSKHFPADQEVEAIEYAKSLEPRFHATVRKIITVAPISVAVFPPTPTQPSDSEGPDPVQDAEPPRRADGRTGGAHPPTGATPTQPLMSDGQPIPMILHCPACALQHIDAPDLNAIVDVDDGTVWTNPTHRSHLCHGCGHIWRPADVPTEGVAEIKTRGKADSPQPPASDSQGGDEDTSEFDAQIDALHKLDIDPDLRWFLARVLAQIQVLVADLSALRSPRS